jgi:gas vesicle protein
MAHAHSIMDNRGQVMGVVAFSAAVGAMAALLFAPRSGGEARKMIGSRVKIMKQKAQRAKDTGSDATENMQGTMGTAKSRLKDTAEKVRGDAKQTTKEMKGAAADAADDVEHIRKHGER